MEHSWYGRAGGWTPGIEARPLISLRELVHVLRQYRERIALAASAGAIAGYLAGQLLPPWYTAEGLLVVDTQVLNIPELQTVTSQRSVEPWGARSAARILTSRANVERAVIALELEHHPAFADGTGAEGLEPIASWRADWLPITLSGGLAGGGTDGQEAPVSRRAGIVEEVRSRLIADSEERSYAILLSYRDHDPDLAARIVNAIMESYVDQEVAAKEAATERASERLKARLDQLWNEWQESNQAIRAMERNEGLVQTAGGTVVSQAMAALALEQVKVRTERAQALADRAQIAAAVEQGSLSVINPELVSPRLRSLWEQETALRVRLAELGSELGERHPRMVALRRDVADLEAKLRAELDNILSSLEQQILTLEERDEELAQAIAAADREASEVAEGRALLEQLNQQGAMKADLYAQYRERYEQTQAALDMQAADVRIASRASPPERGSGPGPNLLGAIGGAFGLLLCCSVIVTRRWLRDHFETLHHLSEITGVEGLGALPQTTSLLRPHRRMTELVVREPDSSVAETVRGILFRIRDRRRDGPPPGVLLVTSPRPTDGKTTLVVTMARVAARDGLRCLAIDCDFRRAALADAFNAQPRRWLSDFINSRGDGSSEELITHDRYSSALCILTRPVRPMSRSLLESPRLKALIEDGRKHFDLILIDTPPIMNVSDPMILARLADVFVMVVSARGSDRVAVLEAVHRAESTGVPVAGVVMSRAGSEMEAYSYKGYPSRG